MQPLSGSNIGASFGGVKGCLGELGVCRRVLYESTATEALELERAEWDASVQNSV